MFLHLYRVSEDELDRWPVRKFDHYRDRGIEFLASRKE